MTDASATSVPASATAESVAADFFGRYADALLARDEKAVAALYAVPALILFPGQSIAVADRGQTEEFFASAWSQYEGETGATRDARIVAEAGHSIWVDVTWNAGEPTAERFVYQLVESDGSWSIAVLTPLAV